MQCTRCGETAKSHALWSGFATAPDADVVCCLIPEHLIEPDCTHRNLRGEVVGYEEQEREVVVCDDCNEVVDIEN